MSTSLGPDGNVLGALSYLFSPVTGILVYLLESENEFARFHAAQSTVFGVVAMVTYFVLNAVATVMAMLVGDILGFLITIFSFLTQMGLAFALFLVWLYLLVMAFQGNQTRLPVLGSLAETYLL
ncbi:DUF4870 domain-containing protein [Natrinema marinum]|uniref:DUF4870 domain-containing protein n=1 Tax=Natrinema marinum TaxID=2961598 RepID=UPI0020C8772C|nr:hypothetical protein [Natrinema marinum]